MLCINLKKALKIRMFEKQAQGNNPSVVAMAISHAEKKLNRSAEKQLQCRGKVCIEGTEGVNRNWDGEMGFEPG